MAKSNVESAVEKQARVFLLTHAARKAREARVRKALDNAYGSHVNTHNDAMGYTVSDVMAEAHRVATSRRWYGALRTRFVAAVNKVYNARLHSTFAKGAR